MKEEKAVFYLNIWELADIAMKSKIVNLTFNEILVYKYRDKIKEKVESDKVDAIKPFLGLPKITSKSFEDIAVSVMGGVGGYFSCDNNWRDGLYPWDQKEGIMIFGENVRYEGYNKLKESEEE